MDARGARHEARGHYLTVPSSEGTDVLIKKDGAVRISGWVQSAANAVVLTLICEAPAGDTVTGRPDELEAVWRETSGRDIHIRGLMEAPSGAQAEDATVYLEER